MPFSCGVLIVRLESAILPSREELGVIQSISTLSAYPFDFGDVFTVIEVVSHDMAEFVDKRLPLLFQRAPTVKVDIIKTVFTGNYGPTDTSREVDNSNAIIRTLNRSSHPWLIPPKTSPFAGPFPA